MSDKTKITIVTVAVIGLLCSIAMLKGIDGALYMTSLAILGYVLGYGTKEIKDKLIK